MSVGNLKDQGNQGKNFPYQLRNLQLLAQIAAGIVPPPGGLATEATLLSVLAALQNGQEFEQNLVVDLGGVGCPANCPTYLQVRIFDTVTHTFGPPIYYDAAGAVVVPVGPLQLVNPQFVLDNILTQVTAINADLDVALSTRASETTVTSILTTVGLLATEATLTILNGRFVPTVRTPGLLRATAAGNIAAGARSVSVFNAGLANGSWLGVAIKPGEQLSYSADGQGDTLGAFAYDGTGTELVITSVV